MQFIRLRVLITAVSALEKRVKSFYLPLHVSQPCHFFLFYYRYSPSLVSGGLGFTCHILLM